MRHFENSQYSLSHISLSNLTAGPFTQVIRDASSEQIIVRPYAGTNQIEVERIITVS